MQARAENKVALITGASYGVGAEAAFALARAGFSLALTATATSNLAATLDRLDPKRVLPLALDLRSQESIDATVAQVLQLFGRIDVLVNNAAANLRRRAVDITRDDWDDLIETNITGTFFLTQEVGRHMIASQTPGRIITIASTHAFVGAPERSAYGISKAALVQMTRMLAIEWAEHGITVNAVAPGRLQTASPSRAKNASDPKYMQEMLRRIPLHRLVTAEEVAHAVAFLVSPHGASITGQTLVLDGGLTAA